jgi:hypothetical protein
MQTGTLICQLPIPPQLVTEMKIFNTGNLSTFAFSTKGIALASVEVYLPHMSNKKWDLSYLVKNF